MVESFRIHAMEKEISFEFQSFKEGVLMDFDPDKLQKAVGNLLSNAIKYTPPGGRILLAVQWTQYPAGQLLLTVSDTGIGIPEEELPFIFDRYYQGPKAHPGSGVGLAYARELASLMGGDISVKSEFGQGATFSLWLPLAKKDLLSTGEIAGVKNEVTLLLEKPLLLIIEDNPDLVRYLQTALEPSYQIEVEMDGGAGLSRARQIVPDIVLSDIMMPGADGYEVCEALKADERTSHIPVVLLTAKSDARSRIDGLRRGADAYLGKPFEMEELMACLENLLESRRRLQVRYGLVALSKVPSAGEEDAFIEKVKAILEEHLSDEKFALPELCRAVGMSRSQLFRKMKALVNDAPSSFIRMYRLHRAKELLETSSLQVSEIAYRVGYRDPAYFSFAFHEAFGITPSLARQ